MPPQTEQARWFSEEMQPHEAELRAYLRGRGLASHDVDDVVQDSFLQMLRRRSHVKFESARAYLFTVARHATLRLFHRQRIFSPLTMNDLPESRLVAGDRDAAETVQSDQQDALVAAAIVALPARCREIFTLRLGEGLSHAEIAVRLGLSEATVRVQVARGVKKCAEFIRERGEGIAS